MGRGAISAQNMGAATALSDRYGMEARNTAQGQINKERYDAEVAQAQQINAAGRRLNLEYAAANGKTGLERKAARASLDSLDKVAAGDQAAKTDKYRVDSAAKGQAAQTASQDKRYADANAIAQSQLGMTRAESQMKLDQAKQLQAAQAEYLGAKTPEERQAAERKLLVLGGKQQSPDEYAYAPGGQQVIDGQTVTQPGVIFNKRTGQQAGGAQQKPAQTFETNKVYTDAKGNRAKWDGKTFVPA